MSNGRPRSFSYEANQRWHRPRTARSSRAAAPAAACFSSSARLSRARLVDQRGAKAWHTSAGERREAQSASSRPAGAGPRRDPVEPRSQRRADREPGCRGALSGSRRSRVPLTTSFVSGNSSWRDRARRPIPLLRAAEGAETARDPWELARAALSLGLLDRAQSSWRPRSAKTRFSILHRLRASWSSQTASPVRHPFLPECPRAVRRG